MSTAFARGFRTVLRAKTIWFTLVVLLMLFGWSSQSMAETTTGYISGRVTDAVSGTAMPSTWVYLYRGTADGGREYYASAATDGSGAYGFGSLPPGTFYVYFSPSLGSHSGQWYRNVIDYAAAVPIPLTDGQAIIGVDAALLRTASLQGTIVGQSGAPVAGVGIRLYQVDGTGTWYSYYGYPSACDASGRYSLEGLQPGTYRVEFVPPNTGAGSNYAAEFFEDKTDVALADDLTLAAGERLQSLDATLGPAGLIEGTVVDAATGDPIQNASISLYRLSGTRWNYFGGDVQTDSQGRYRIGGLASGTYRVGVSSAVGYSSWWFGNSNSVSSAADVLVESGRTTSSIDIALSAAGSMSGRVTDAETGQPVSSTWVRFYRRTVRPWATPEITWGRAADVGTSEDGSFSCEGLAPGVYKLEALPAMASPYSPYGSAFYPGASSFDSAHELVLESGQKLTGLDVTLRAGNRIVGQVSSESSDTPVMAIALQQRAGTWTSVWNAQVSDGSYAIAGLADGEYRVQFRPAVSSSASQAALAPQYFPGVTAIEAAADISVSGGSTAVADVHLTTGAMVEGVVVDGDTGNPVSGVPVMAYAFRGSALASAASRSGLTDAAGHYTIDGLAPGEYWVMARGPVDSYGQEFYLGATSVDDAIKIAVAKGETRTGIDFALQPTALIQGAVHDSDGDPVVGASVQALVRQAGAWTSRRAVVTDSLGRYTLDGLVAGDYRVAFWDSSGTTTATSYWQGATDVGQALPVALGRGETLTGVDGLLDRNTFRRVRGIVRDSAAVALEGVRATLYRRNSQTSTWESVRSMKSDAQGVYNFRGLAPGEYTVGFESPTGEYQPRFYGDADSLAAAQVITLAPDFRGSADVTLRALPRVSGHVVDNGGRGLAGITVELFRTIANSQIKMASASTDVAGGFKFSALPEGTYRVAFSDPANRYLSQCYSGSSDLEDAAALELGLDDERSDINATLSAKAVMRGRLSDSTNGAGIAGVTVTAGRLDGGAWTDMGSFTTTSSGGYELRVPAGTYRLRYTDPQSRYLTMMYPSVVSGSFTDTRAVDVALVADQVRDDLNSTLLPYGHIRGRVANVSDQPLGGIGVIAYRAGTSGWQAWRQTSTDSSGTYDLGGLSPATYRVQFRDNTRGHLDAFYPDVATAVVSGEGIADITLGAGESTSTVDAHLQPLAMDGHEPDNAIGQAATIAPGVRQEHVMTIGNSVDWVTFSAHAGTRYDLMIPRSEGVYGLYVDLFDAEGRSLGSGLRAASYVCETTGTVYARVTSNDAIFGGYSLDLAATTLTRPKVTQIWPSSGTTISGTRQQVAALVSAESRVASVAFEYSTDGGATWNSIGAGSSGSVPLYGLSNWSFPAWDTTALPAGPVLVRAVARDEVGLVSTGTAGVPMVVDNDPPSRPVGMKATPRALDILVEWDAVQDPALAGYEVYRRPAAGGTMTLRARVSNTRFADSGVAEGEQYAYEVRAVDQAGNASAPSDVISAWAPVDNVLPTAAAGADREALVGTALLFDATGSADDRGVSSYVWDFGDGTTATGFSPSHAFQTEGEYAVTLTVSDAHGNKAVDSLVVWVRTPAVDEAADLQVTVRTTEAAAIRSAQVVVEQADGVRLSGITDASGIARFKVKPGAVIAYAFKDGMMPAKTTTRLEPAGSGALTIDLENQDVMLGELTVKPMTLEEITEAGIDVSNPQNLHTQSFTLEWGNKTLAGIVGRQIYVEDADFDYVFGVNGENTTSTANWGNSDSDDVDPSWSNTPRYAYVIVTGKSAWLKEMFGVTLNLKNLATDDAFHLVDTQATLKLEPGMSLAAMAAPAAAQTAEQTIADIGPQQQKSVHWYVSGDKAGEYGMSVDVATSLTPFSGRLYRQYATPNKVRVYGAGGLTTALGYPKKVRAGETFVVTATLRNMMPHDAYLVSARLDPPQGADLVEGETRQSCEVLGRDQTFEATWTLKSRHTGELLLEDNEGDISGWMRWSDISGDEVVIPFVPEDPKELATVQQGGKSHRYFRVVEPDTASGEHPVGVWFVEGEAHTSLERDGESARITTQTVSVDNRWPAGVFALTTEDLGTEGAEFSVDMDRFSADGYELDASRIDEYRGRVTRAEDTVDRYVFGNQLRVSGHANVAEVDITARSELEGRSYPELAGSVAETDLDLYGSVEGGISAKARFPLEIKSPVVQFEGGASAESKLGPVVHAGVGTRYTLSAQDEKQTDVQAAMMTDWLRSRGLKSPRLTTIAKRLSAEAIAERDLTRVSAGAGVAGHASSRVGGSVGLGPKGVVGVSLDLLKADAEYECGFTGSVYPSPSEGTPQVGFAINDRASASAKLLSVTATSPWADEYAASLFKNSIEGESTMETLFNIDQIDDVIVHGDPTRALDRIELTVDDSADNIRYVFTLEGSTVRKLLQQGGAGGGDEQARTLAFMLTQAMSARGANGQANVPAIPGVTGALTKSLIGYADKIEVIAGTKPSTASQDFSLGLDFFWLLGADAEVQTDITASRSALITSGLMRDGIVYPLETHEMPKGEPHIPAYVGTMLKLLGTGAERATEGINNVTRKPIDANGQVITGSTGGAVAQVAALNDGAAPAGQPSALVDPGQNAIAVEVPAGAVAEETTFSVTSYLPVKDSDDPVGPARVDGLAVVGALHEVTPSQVSVPATVTLSWAATETVGIDADSLAIWRFDAAEARWVRMDSELDLATRTASATTTALGTFAIGTDADGPEINLVAPAVGSTLAAPSAWFACSIRDELSGVETDTVAVTIDGAPVAASQDASTGLLWAQASALSQGQHTLAVTVMDRSGVASSMLETFSVDYRRPSAPSGLEVTCPGGGAQLRWSASDEEGVSYRVYRKSAEETQAVCVGYADGLRYLDCIAPGGVGSSYYVTAVDAAGNESDASAPVAQSVMYAPTLSIEATSTDEGVSVRTVLLGSYGLPLDGEGYRIDALVGSEPASRVVEVTQTASVMEFTLPPVSEVTTLVAVYGGSQSYTGTQATVLVRPARDDVPTSRTEISLSSGSAILPAYGASFKLEGKVSSEGKPAAGRRVVLQRSADGVKFKDTSVGTTTDAQGDFTLSVIPRVRTVYRVRALAATGAYGAVGASVYALPRALVSRPIAPTEMHRTRRQAVFGYLRPRHAGGTSPVRIYRWYRGSTSDKWEPKGYVTATASDYSSYTKYSCSLKLPTAGYWKLRSYAPADDGHAATWSKGYDIVRVR